MLRQARHVRFEGAKQTLPKSLRFSLSPDQPSADVLILTLASPASLERDHPRSLPNAASKAVTPISPAAQKFHLFILCSALDNSVTVSNSSLPGLMLGKRHIADVNQNIAEPHAAIITPVSINDLMNTPNGPG